MAATLNVQFTDPVDPNQPSTDPIRAVLTQAFNEWTRHFDYTAGTCTINVSFRAANQPADVRLGGLGTETFVGGAYVAESFGLRFAGRPADPSSSSTGTMYVNPAYLTGARAPSDAVAPMERELGHALGIYASINNVLRGPVNIFPRTLYQRSVSFRVTTSDTGSNVTTFDGPNAVAAYGGPVPVLSADPGTTTVGGGRPVPTTTEGAGTLQPLDIALLRDAGLPALTDQELGEHQVARLYVAAFGRNADSTGLIAQYAGLRSGLTLAQLGDGFVSSAEFANRYGVPSDADFINALYQNVLGRAPDAPGAAFYQGALARGASRGTLLAAFADSDEDRGRLNGSPNVTYAATAEAQVARMYDAAFGRDADPAGFNANVRAVINGTSLQAVALSFLASPEFASRYGAAPADQALVDGFYQNTLHRAPDAAGEAQYLGALASGTFSRADLLVAFADSQEHAAVLAQRTAARSAGGSYLDLSPHLGLIPVLGGSTTL